MSDSKSEGMSPETAAVQAVCWSCRTNVDARALFCHVCGLIQPPRSIDHFSRLGIRQQFDIDLKELERQYFGFQRRFHPDRFATKTASERAFSLQHATALNEAYEVLRSPLSRGRYLLELLNRPVLAEGDHTVSDPGLLAEAMAMRESLADADGRAELDALAADVAAKTEDCLGSLATAFATVNLNAAARDVLRLGYLERLDDELHLRQVPTVGSA
ncbi:MAG: Fe-S protein assembly co-chaperone HscB [Alphaproteobacteria bacterium]|nr:Fe-S protein assembly co-chaperone HscB [Alphaproteobacteria bacterium]